MAQFKPKGDRSLRSIIVDLAARAPYGELFTYQQLTKELSIGDDFSYSDPRPVIRSAVTQARTALIRDHGRVLIAERGKGYRVGKPGELESVATSHRERSERQLDKALKIVTHAKTDDMTDAEYQRFMATKTAIVGLHRRMNKIEDRMAAIERAVFGEPPVPVPGEVIERSDRSAHQRTS